MTAQQPEVKAYVFVMQYAGGHTKVGVIASSAAEAQEAVAKQYGHHSGEATFFGCASAIMQPAKVEWWRGFQRFERQGYYTFLEGIFFLKCDDCHAVESCRREKTSYGWMALAYPKIYSIRPL